MTTIDLTDDGFITLLVRKRGQPEGTPPVAVELDTFATHNTLYELRVNEWKAAEDEKRVALPGEVCAKWLNDTHKLGCSAAFALKLVEALKGEVDRIQKKGPSDNSASIPKPSGSPSGLTPGGDSPPA